MWFKFTAKLSEKVDPDFSLLKLYTPDYMNETEPYLNLKVMYGMGFVLQFKDKRRLFDPDLYFSYMIEDRWSFLGFSVMNLKEDEIKICFSFPPDLMDCSIKYKGVVFNSDYLYRMVIGEKFIGIIRTLKVLNWPKLDIHFKSKYLTSEYCGKYEGNEKCEICSPEFREGSCFPNCKLD